MKKKAVIFGAGDWGELAYFYYREKCQIIYYIDNEKQELQIRILQEM